LQAGGHRFDPGPLHLVISCSWFLLAIYPNISTACAATVVLPVCPLDPVLFLPEMFWENRRSDSSAEAACDCPRRCSLDHCGSEPHCGCRWFGREGSRVAYKRSVLEEYIECFVRAIRHYSLSLHGRFMGPPVISRLHQRLASTAGSLRYLAGDVGLSRSF
jgi:hypothetical protein